MLNLFQPLTHSWILTEHCLRNFYGFEITIGIQAISSSSAGLLTQLVTIEALLAWNGLAIQAQVTGMLADSDLKVKYYLTRLLQIPLAMLITIFGLPSASAGMHSINQHWNWHSPTGLGWYLFNVERYFGCMLSHRKIFF